jgi:Fic family protein
VPEPLPPNLNQKTYQQVSKADRMLGRLDVAAATLPDRGVLVTSTRCQEIQSTLALRGVTVATKEIAHAGLLGGVKPEDRMARYVQYLDQAIRNVERMSVGYALLRAATGFARLSDDSLSDDDLPLRTTPHWFGGSSERAYHHAVSPGAELNAATEELVAWIDDTDDMPLIGKVAEGAFRLYTLAPFPHTPDLLHVHVALELIKAGALSDQIVATSVHIDRNRLRFRRIHQRAVETGDLNEWVRFFATGIIEQCGNQLNVVEQLGQLHDRNMTLVGAVRRHGFARFVSSLASFEVITAKLVAERCGVTEKYARDMLHRAEGLGIVVEIGRRKRNRVYEAREVRQLLDRSAGMVPAGYRTVHNG